MALRTAPYTCGMHRKLYVLHPLWVFEGNLPPRSTRAGRGTRLLTRMLTRACTAGRNGASSPSNAGAQADIPCQGRTSNWWREWASRADIIWVPLMRARPSFDRGKSTPPFLCEHLCSGTRGPLSICSALQQFTFAKERQAHVAQRSQVATGTRTPDGAPRATPLH